MKVTMEIVYMHNITRIDAKRNPEIAFIFGDNDARSGFGGLAKELRGEPNAYGIRVKKKPTRDVGAYYTDNELKENVQKITEDINHIINKIKWNQSPIIIYPTNGIGTGLASMKTQCPETFNAMNLLLEQTLGIKNGV